MNFVIPMAGRGQRFIDQGFIVPKPLVESHGKTLLEWSIDSLPLELCTNLICIILETHCDEFELDEFLKKKYDNRNFQLHIHKVKTVTRGQAETVYISKDLWDFNLGLVIFNADTAFYSSYLSRVLDNHPFDGVVCCFNSNEDRFSYAKLDDNSGFIIETAEKVVISNFALNGFYHFSKPRDYTEAFEHAVFNDLKIRGEFYVAPLYNYLIQNGKQFILHSVDRNFILGTPEELKLFNP
jgi:dTDP-glucose pyrophosphorylase